MMATTHVLAGIALAGVVAAFAPEFAGVAIAAAVLGSVFPDLDLYAAHRRTLHYPVYYSIAALCALAIAGAVPGELTVGLALFLLSAALHSAMDALGGGLELRPWRGESEEAVYSHYHGRWIRPRRWIRYDGAPEDLALAALLAAPTLLVFDAPLRTVVLGLLAISAGYALVRKPLVDATEWVVERMPDSILAKVPGRLLDSHLHPEPDDAERG